MEIVLYYTIVKEDLLMKSNYFLLEIEILIEILIFYIYYLKLYCNVVHYNFLFVILFVIMNLYCLQLYKILNLRTCYM